MPKPRIIAIASQKGGVGKTTTTANLAAAAAVYRSRVLMVDFDPQFALTRAFGLAPSQAPATIRDVISVVLDDEEGEIDLAAVVAPVGEGIDLIAGHRALAGLERQLSREPERGHLVLKEALEGGVGGYDVVFVDCPPNLGLLTLNALCAADEVLVPVAMNDPGAFQGAAELKASLGRAQKGLGARAEITAVVRTAGAPWARTHRDIEEALPELGLPISDTMIPERKAFNNALAAGRPLVWAQRSHEGASAYRSLASELKVA